MNTQLVTTGRQERPPQPVRGPESHTVRRVSPLDRAALHLGIALIKWGRRSVRRDLRDEIALNGETHEARKEMQRARDQQAANLPRFL